MPSTQHIVLSPHYDDAALSLGGAIAQLALAGEPVTVTTVFGGKPNLGQLSPFAASIHARMGGDPDLVSLRQREDAEAMAILGARSRPGDYLDCIYRRDETGTRWLYDSQSALFGPIASVERGLSFELAQVIASLAGQPAGCILYAPLAVGRHVDHQILHRAGLILLDAGYQVQFYEDFPYVLRDPNGLAKSLDRSPRRYWRSRLVPLSEEALARKVQAIAAYRSQIGVLFGSEEHIQPAVESYARRAGGGAVAVERLWECAARSPAASGPSLQSQEIAV
ncbi:MAG: PIG-L family deacetylase [Caldilineales bacterium]|nr:PIG-L family deacetylase [Caldilineales bacterium]MDW8318468.1 PIG-L family deacetylase [Anaerolineae bacterium]